MTILLVLLAVLATIVVMILGLIYLAGWALEEEGPLP